MITRARSEANRTPRNYDAAITGMAAEYEAQQNVVDQERREEEEEEAAQDFPADNQVEPRVVRVPDSVAELDIDEDGDFDCNVERRVCIHRRYEARRIHAGIVLRSSQAFED